MLINLIIILQILILLGLWYLIKKGRKDSIDNLIKKSAKKFNDDFKRDISKTSTAEMKGLEYFLDDTIKPGIVYRPTAEEIEKMNEPENIRQAKEAIEETIKNTPEPI